MYNNYLFITCTLYRNSVNLRFDFNQTYAYRVNSKQGTRFRICATNRLKYNFVEDYIINEKHLVQKNRPENRATIAYFNETN